MTRILAIDYGKKRIGVATTDSEQIIATALDTISNKEIYSFLQTYIKKEEVEEIVVGHPKHTNNKDADLMQDIYVFVNKIKQLFPKISVELFDERFTSKRAVFAMIEAGYKKKVRQNKANIDKISATILLQDFMHFKKSKLINDY